MGKRSEFERVEKDFYATIDPNAIVPTFIERIRGKTYAEPCYGDGDLEDMLREIAKCRWRSDIRETVLSSVQMDAMEIDETLTYDCDLIITNPPYKKEVLLPMIDQFQYVKPTWLLLPADMMHNKYFGPYIKRCQEIISVGRLYWQENKVRGKDNYCWYFFPKGGEEGSDIQCKFRGRDD